ncbi:MAG: MmgE/PrpD family protein [Flavonifractor plautii]
MLTEQLSDFLYEVRYDSLPSKAVDNAKLYLGDLLGVAAAGSVQPQGGIWRSYFAAGDGQQEATAWNSGLERFSCEHAAALNAACAHVMDMDDVHNASITHLGAVTIPAALAVGQKLHRSGREVLAAIAAGYEIGARVGEAINPGSYHYWHTTGVVGALCSAVAAGKLMGLDRKKLLHAIGSAGTQAAGLWQFLEDGAMSKTLHTANGTLCGLRSARLAALGFTAAEDILAGDRGLLGAMTPDNHPEALTRALSWENCALLTNSLKPYACCRHTHAADYCAQLLRGAPAGAGAHHPHCGSHLSGGSQHGGQSGAIHPYGYKFSGQYCTAAMLVYGHLGESAFTPEATSDPRVRRLMDKITLVCDPELEASYQADRNRWAHRLEVTLEDGRVLTRQVEYPYGDFNNPFTWAYEHEKFHTLADGVLGPDRVAALVERLPHLEELDDINRLFEGL